MQHRMSIVVGANLHAISGNSQMFLAECRDFCAEFVIIARVNSTDGLEANVCARLVAAVLPHGGVGESGHNVLCGLAEHFVYRCKAIHPTYRWSRRAAYMHAVVDLRSVRTECLRSDTRYRGAFRVSQCLLLSTSARKASAAGFPTSALQIT